MTTTVQAVAEQVSRVLEKQPAKSGGILIYTIAQQARLHEADVTEALAELVRAGYVHETIEHVRSYKSIKPYRHADHDPRHIMPIAKRPDAGLAELSWQLRSGARGRAPEGMFS